MGVTWSQRPTDIMAHIQGEVDGVIQRAMDCIEIVITAGEADMRDFLLAATTQWGEVRQAQGRSSAGRVETGDMISNVDHKMLIRTDTHALGEFGWLNGFLEEYWAYQEHGTSRIDAADSLNQSAIRAKDLFLHLVHLAVKS